MDNGFPGGAPDLAQLQSTMRTIDQACSSILLHINPAEAEKVLCTLRQSPMPYKSCRFILENSKVPHARFEAAGAIADAAMREWGILNDGNRGSLVSFCVSYVMQHSSSADFLVQSKVAAVAAQLIKRGWHDLPQQSKMAVFSEVKQAVLGMYGVEAQFGSISFLKSLVSEFSPSTSSAMGLPAEFHEQCKASLELSYLKEFYCWAQTSAMTVSVKIIDCTATSAEAKVCCEALHLMDQILNWNFKHDTGAADKMLASSGGIRHDITLLKNFDRSLVQPGSSWRDVLISSGQTMWILNFYAILREKNSSDVLWFDSTLAASARQLIVQLCSLSGSIFPSDDGGTQIKHLMQILAATLAWIDPPESMLAAIRFGRSDMSCIKLSFFCCKEV